MEEFTHLYTILLTFYNDKQKEVDRFIITQQPLVLQTQKPDRPAGTMETRYTRLRNELAHRRVGVDVVNTKAEAINQLAALRGLVKKAIELHP